MAPAQLEQKKQAAIRSENIRHTGTIELLSSHEFWERHQEGLDQIKAGKTVSFEHLRSKYGTHR